MLTLSNRSQLAVGVALLTLFAVTRGYHTPSFLHALPSVSWAVFFLAGVYLRPAWVLAALLSFVALLDYAAVTWGGVSSFCISPAYVALIPAYGALWLAGRFYRRFHMLSAAALLPLTIAVVAGALACEIISSGAFYFFSGRFTEPDLAGFGARLVRYFPANLGSLAFHVGLAAIVHAVVTLTRPHAMDRDTA